TLVQGQRASQRPEVNTAGQVGGKENNQPPLQCAVVSPVRVPLGGLENLDIDMKPLSHLAHCVKGGSNSLAGPKLAARPTLHPALGPPLEKGHQIVKGALQQQGQQERPSSASQAFEERDLAEQPCCQHMPEQRKNHRTHARSSGGLQWQQAQELIAQSLEADLAKLQLQCRARSS
ncbi:hypothetical protein HaLaN_26510, partial [Haematococcus lacustris]